MDKNKLLKLLSGLGIGIGIGTCFGSVFYSMELEVFEKKASLMKTRTKKSGLSEAQFTNVHDFLLQKEKVKFFDEVSGECGYCMVVYFLGILTVFNVIKFNNSIETVYAMGVDAVEVQERLVDYDELRYIYVRLHPRSAV